MSGELMTAVLDVSGVRVEVYGRPDDLYFRSVAESGSVFEPAVAIARSALATDAVVLDVGASIGLVSGALCGLLTRGRIVAFEPEPRALECLRRTVADLGDRVTVVPSAVGAEQGSLRFHQDPNGTAWGMLSDREPSVEVTVTTIDDTVDALGLDRVDLVKIDVEGFEVPVLHGGSRTLERYRPILVAELNPYCLWRHGRTLPQDLVEAVQALYPHVVAVRGDASVVALEGRAVDDLLYELGTSGGLADLVASVEPLDLSGLATFAARPREADASLAAPDGADEPEPAPEWNPRADLARVRRAVAWRARSAAGRLRRGR
jgi:FkbM family methyltransferase